VPALLLRFVVLPVLSVAVMEAYLAHAVLCLKAAAVLQVVLLALLVSQVFVVAVPSSWVL
jgi:hypothetical protein